MRPTQTTQDQPKNILITHVYSSDNKGDAALTSVLINDIKRIFPDCNITILKLDNTEPGSQFEGMPEKAGFMSYAVNQYKNPLVKLLYTAYMVSATLLWVKLGSWVYLPKNIREVAIFYKQADLIVPVGGGYIRSRPGLLNRLNVPLLLHPLYFGYLLAKPTVLYSQSVGPFQNKLEKQMAAFVLKHMSLILIREDKSIELLAKLGVKDNVKRAIDSGFLLNASEKINLRKEYKIPKGKLLVGVTVRSWLEGAAQVKYERAVAKALDHLIENHNAYAIFIPQVTASKGDDDRITSRKVYDHLKNKNFAQVVEDTPDHHRIKAMYDKLDILLGTRFHSVIFSLTSYVPVLAIEYEHKTSGIMRDLHLEPWVINIESVTAQNLTSLLKNLVQKRPEYKAHLQEHLPPYIKKASQTANMLTDI
jgi:colanic acid/amylovoran biosynthesis protein